MPTVFVRRPVFDLDSLTEAQQTALAKKIADNLVSSAPGNQIHVGEDNLLALRDATRYPMTVTATNVLSQLPVLPLDPSSMVIEVNTQEFDHDSGAFTVVGRVVTWVPGVAGFSLEPSDAVFAIYK